MSEKTLDELIDTADPGIRLIREWTTSAKHPCEILSSSAARELTLLELQVTTRSTLGALAYDTGGILVDHGWLRFLGSGHPRLTRSLSTWNRDRSDGIYLVADDAVGGFYAINAGAFGRDAGKIYYWPPDSLDWQPLEMGLTDLLHWSLTSRLADYYQDLRWPGWKEDLLTLSPEQCFDFYPSLWTKEGSIQQSDRRPIPVAEAFGLKMEIVASLLGNERGSDPV